jgi:hypothetical protein
MPSVAVIGSRLHDLFSGVFALPLTVLRRVRGSWAGGWGRCALRRGVRTWSGWVRPRGRAARRLLPTGLFRPERIEGVARGHEHTGSARPVTPFHMPAGSMTRRPTTSLTRRSIHDQNDSPEAGGITNPRRRGGSPIHQIRHPRTRRPAQPCDQAVPRSFRPAVGCKVRGLAARRALRALRTQPGTVCLVYRVIDAGMRTALLRRIPCRLIVITLLLDYSMACRCRDQGCADR